MGKLKEKPIGRRSSANPMGSSARVSSEVEKKTTTVRRSPARKSKKRPTLEQIEAWLDSLTAGLPPLPALPADFSREDIYDDHD